MRTKKKEKIHFTLPNYLLCPLNLLNKILAQFTPPNNLVWLNLPPNRIYLFCFGLYTLYLRFKFYKIVDGIILYIKKIV
uniref:Uncharacterized protein n=1 Tax=Arundo donax TaxID=35708 RepID=A0A0A9D6M2_ARUDO